MSSDIYRERILDYYRHPRNYGEIPDAQIRAKDANPLCGDTVAIDIKMDEKGMVSDVKFSGKGCAISMASASVLTEMVKGRSLGELKALGKDDILKVLGIEALPLNPVRIKCALLPLKVLKMGVYTHLGERISEEEVRVLEQEV